MRANKVLGKITESLDSRLDDFFEDNEEPFEEMIRYFTEMNSNYTKAANRETDSTAKQEYLRFASIAKELLPHLKACMQIHRSKTRGLSQTELGPLDPH